MVFDFGLKSEDLDGVQVDIGYCYEKFHHDILAVHYNKVTPFNHDRIKGLAKVSNSKMTTELEDLFTAADNQSVQMAITLKEEYQKAQKKYKDCPEDWIKVCEEFREMLPSRFMAIGSKLCAKLLELGSKASTSERSQIVTTYSQWCSMMNRQVDMIAHYPLEMTELFLENLVISFKLFLSARLSPALTATSLKDDISQTFQDGVEEHHNNIRDHGKEVHECVDAFFQKDYQQWKEKIQNLQKKIEKKFTTTLDRVVKKLLEKAGKDGKKIQRTKKAKEAFEDGVSESHKMMNDVHIQLQSTKDASKDQIHQWVDSSLHAIVVICSEKFKKFH